MFRNTSEDRKCFCAIDDLLEKPGEGVGCGGRGRKKRRKSRGEAAEKGEAGTTYTENSRIINATPKKSEKMVSAQLIGKGQRRTNSRNVRGGKVDLLIQLLGAN